MERLKKFFFHIKNGNLCIAFYNTHFQELFGGLAGISGFWNQPIMASNLLDSVLVVCLTCMPIKKWSQHSVLTEFIFSGCWSWSCCLPALRWNVNFPLNPNLSFQKVDQDGTVMVLKISRQLKNPTHACSLALYPPHFHVIMKKITFSYTSGYFVRFFFCLLMGWCIC